MKNSLACPKCQGRKIWQINGESGPSTLRPIAMRTESKGDWIKVLETRELGHYDAYTCAGCGYTEFFAGGVDELRHHPEAGVQLLDTTPQQGEYR
ncbi:MAG: hypothetical protein JRI23_04130 [Deltaproteobacteria bacterium]|jgi:predicted nucleic-acid-binding Zn-ribbon protein|nr:hypothetical protein [Deltaproteobacteria bacterium]MBW2530715.1 hypothetical protein [Deltaproteobacteria bacterium]